MKKTLLSAFVISSLIIGISLTTQASQVIEKENGYVSASASSTKEIAPNQAEITINIETSDKSLQKAADENKIIADKVYSNLKSIIGTSDYIKTQNYSANPVYVYTKDNKRVLDKYVVTNNVVVKTKNTLLVPKIIDSSIASGATNVNNLDFSVSDYESACNELLSGLTKRAFNQANAIAQSINSQIIGTKSINSTCNPENNNPRPYMMMMAKGGAENDSQTPVESGKIRIYANIDASFYVK